MATPVQFIPMYIRQTIQDPHGFIVRADRWNALWNLNIQQGDNNAQGIDTLTKSLNALRAEYDGTVVNTYDKVSVDGLLSAKENKTVTALHVKDVTFDKNTGVFTFTKEDGSFLTVDTALERVALDVRLDPVTSELVLTLADGTEQRVSLASFIDTYTFKDSATISWSKLGDTYTPQLVPGSVKMEHLGIPLQDTLTGYVNAAAGSATLAEQHKTAAANSATQSASSAADAQASKAAAVLSAANAKSSEDAAALSKTAAANAAGSAAQNASASEASAVRSEAAAKKAEAIAGGDFATNTALNAHTNDTNNPHNVTKAQLGLENVDNTADSQKTVKRAYSSAFAYLPDLTVCGNNFLDIDKYNEAANKMHTVYFGSYNQIGWTNSPLSSGAFFGVRQVFSTGNYITVHLMETYPKPGRTWDRVYDKTTSTWSDKWVESGGVTALLAAHTSNVLNPHGVTKAQVGLGNVDNTADADKPVSTAQQLAIGNAANGVLTTAQTFIPKENLLDNSNFLNPVNQHYTTTATGGGYVAIDRWTHATSVVVTKIVATGWEISGGDATYGAPVIQKVIYDPSKTYTFSVCTADGVIYSVTGTAATNAKLTTPFGSIAITLYSNLLSVQITVSYGKSVILKWAQLVEGTVATPYRMRPYAVELAECQRYYRDMVISAVKTQGSFYSLSQTINMRANPTYTLAAFSPYGAGNVTDFTGCSVEVTKEFITYANLPTCTTYNAGGVRILLNANL